MAAKRKPKLEMGPSENPGLRLALMYRDIESAPRVTVLLSGRKLGYDDLRPMDLTALRRCDVFLFGSRLDFEESKSCSSGLQDSLSPKWSDCRIDLSYESKASAVEVLSEVHQLAVDFLSALRA